MYVHVHVHVVGCLVHVLCSVHICVYVCVLYNVHVHACVACGATHTWYINSTVYMHVYNIHVSTCMYTYYCLPVEAGVYSPS